MQPRTETCVAGWEPRSAATGYAGLGALAESEFSGAIAASGATLFMLNGRAIGLFGGSIEEFRAAPLTAHSAPHPALPLLLSMRERGGETRATYYTDETPIESTQETLESSGFTGYVELSENVLSGDYFVVYHRGRSMSVGFVGSTDRLLTDEDAASRLADEVGIYTVEAVDVDEIPIPDATADTGTATDLDESSGTDATDGDPAPDEPNDARTEARAVEEETDSERDPPEANRTDSAEPTAPTESELNADSDHPVADVGAPSEPTDASERWGSVIEEPVEDRIAAERQWRETTRIPSLDPARSALATTEAEATPPAETAPEPGEELLSQALDALESERKAREDAERTITRLREEVEDLERRLAAQENAPSTDSGSESETPSGRELDPRTALSGTNLFVRYASKGAATLEDAHAGEIDRETLAENLRLERRTEFEAADVTVDGDPFEGFLTNRLEHRFAEWLVGELPFELAATGHANSLGALYDALPAIDRIEFDGVIETEAGSWRFDVICRDRMGEALVVLDCDATRAATTADRVAALVEEATDAKTAATDLAGAMVLTTSYFDPEALSTAEEATRSGLLGGDSRESYVTISRRTGYHLCLIETHDGTFHLTVPEL
ncbi:DUF7527 domain-containing protein [Halalkalicoccus jeotgali]|uniref:DUF7527 domain-containing protein n=1 Tax=Halalkalicoccus jeotgali (strain DSM 18796 / CECT 7217 / JCM 14584 / KCTC 4019 / B3) TaxID=795797 RepID=D8J2V3_HALJB|nr:hypothetical protein [Halalkalicoccus jeotgali]ADJ15060.1 hypothetical protein HacjB3_08385 [Halalkalicoccus jeotgali B3]ELY34922.1 hypothetical protein C497_14322 [Halalkalicoccus jeotgali B3]